MLEELRVQAELTRDALSIPWHPRWATLLVQWLSWDLLRASNAPTSVGPSGPARDKGTPTKVEGEILLGLPGVAIP